MVLKLILLLILFMEQVFFVPQFPITWKEAYLMYQQTL